MKNITRLLLTSIFITFSSCGETEINGTTDDSKPLVYQEHNYQSLTIRIPDHSGYKVVHSDEYLACSDGVSTITVIKQKDGIFRLVSANFLGVSIGDGSVITIHEGGITSLSPASDVQSSNIQSEQTTEAD